MATLIQKIRIKVLIDDTGNYCGYGWKNAADKDPDDTLYDVIESVCTRAYWITAELPIPGRGEEEVKGEVEVVSKDK